MTDRATESNDPGEPRDVDQALSDLSQTHSDHDQSAADHDGDASQRDSTASLSDQASASVDQAASDADQASSDRELAAEPSPSRAQQQVHAESRTERRDATGARRVTERSRTESELARVEGEAQRHEVAALRDDVAAERDDAARLRDRSAGRADAALLAAYPGSAVLSRALEGHAEARSHADADRQRAADDRVRAAHDRERSARERRQARIDVQRAHLDGLTGVYLRELGYVTLQHELDRCRRMGEPFVLVFIDVDGLTALNTAHGHAAGDALIASVVRALRATLRTYDPIVRVDGVEFLCGLPATELAVAHHRVEQIREAIGRGHPSGSISVGYGALDEGDTLTSLIARADADMALRRHDG